VVNKSTNQDNCFHTSRPINNGKPEYQMYQKQKDADQKLTKSERCDDKKIYLKYQTRLDKKHNKLRLII